MAGIPEMDGACGAVREISCVFSSVVGQPSFSGNDLLYIGFVRSGPTARLAALVHFKSNPADFSAQKVCSKRKQETVLGV